MGQKLGFKMKQPRKEEKNDGYQQTLKLRIEDMLKKEVDETYYLPKNQVGSSNIYDVDIYSKQNLKTQLCNRLVTEYVLKGGEIINHSYTKSKQRPNLEDYIESDNGIVPTLTTRPDIMGYVENKDNKIRIRKLTSKECWRLMGFDDDDYEKAELTSSRKQLYQQARK